VHTINLFVVDLFQKVIPMVVRNAVVSFEYRKSEIVFREIGRLREATQALNTYVVSMYVVCQIGFGECKCRRVVSLMTRKVTELL
jgi:hypothetical protein